MELGIANSSEVRSVSELSEQSFYAVIVARRTMPNRFSYSRCDFLPGLSELFDRYLAISILRWNETTS